MSRMGSDAHVPIEVFGYAAKDTTGHMSPFKFTRKYVIHSNFIFKSLCILHNSKQRDAFASLVDNFPS